MRHKAAEVPTDYAMPRRTFSLIELQGFSMGRLALGVNLPRA
jgi:hypothetical protein